MRSLKSLEIRLPLMAGAMLLTTIAALVFASYAAVRRTTLLGSSARLLGSSEQIAALLRTSGDTLLATTRAVGRAPAVIAWLRHPGREAPSVLIAALEGVPQPDRLVAAELRDSTGRRVFRWGPLAGDVDSMRVGEIDRMVANRGPATLGGFRAVGKTILYPVGAPVFDGAVRLGSIIHWRKQVSSAQSRDQISTLFGGGPGSAFLLGDTTGRVWTDLVSRVAGPPVQVPVKPGSPPIEYDEPGQGRRFAAARQGPGTPWVALIEVPRAVVMQPVDSFVRQIGVIALVFLVLAAFASWEVSRSVTRPLALLGAAADAFNTGDHTRRVNLDREDELGQVAGAFNRMADGVQSSFEALKDADRKKDEFLATLAHELRNPLAPIQNGVTALRVASPARDPHTARMYDIMERQLGILTRLVDDLLEISRVTRGTVELRKESVDLSTVVQQALETARPIIAAAGHTLKVDVAAGLHVQGDPVRLSQILFNLLNNAAKYTPRGGHIGLEVRREGEEAVITVRDDGEGIPPDMLERIFDIFIQVHRSANRRTGGLGVGLTLVRELTELHGGTVRALSAGPGQGSEFIVRLPLNTATSQRPAAIRGGSGGIAARPKGMRALVVDDNKDAADAFAMLLGTMDVEATVVYGGQKALDTLATFDPEIVFLDIGMPGMDGFEVARRIRAMDGPRMTLVAVTGWGTDQDRRRSAEVGFDHHLVKPVHADVLRELVGSLQERVA